MATQAGVINEKLDFWPSADVSGGDWDAAVSRRDEIVNIIHHVLERSQIHGLVQVSQPGVFPPWVRLEAWLPLEGSATARERTSLEFVIESFAFHRHPVVTTARLVRGKKTMEMCLRPHFSIDDVREWVEYAVGVGERPQNYKPVSEALGNIIRAFIPVPGPTHNPVANRYKGSAINGITLIVGFSALLLLSVFLGMLGNAYDPTSLPLILIGVAGMILAAVLASRHRRFVKPAPQSRALPMRLGLVDSWHEVIPALGADFESVRAKVTKGLETLRANGIAVRSERYGYDTPQGYEERERVVVSTGQCVLHIYLHPFGNDVFVAWQSNLNWGKWTETAPVSVKGLGRDVIEFRGVRPGFYFPSEIDLIDLNALSDLVHRRLATTLQGLLRERAIDSDIDFEIVRGNREAALSAKQGADSAQSGGWFGNRPAPGTMAWKPQAVTEREKPSGPAGPQRSETSVSKPSGSFVQAGIVALAALGVAYALDARGLMYAPQYAISFPLNSSYTYSYNPGMDFATVSVIAASLGLLFGVPLLRAALVFVALYAAAFLCDVAFYGLVSGSFATSEEFYQWLADDPQRNFIWIPYVLAYGVASLTVLSLLVPAMADRRIWVIALLTLVVSQTAIWAYGQSEIYQISSILFLLPNFLFSGAVAYWMSRPESRSGT